MAKETDHPDNPGRADRPSEFAPKMVAILRERDVARLTGLHRTWRWKLIQKGLFPAPVKLGTRAIGTRSDELQQWIDARQRQAGRAA